MATKTANPSPALHHIRQLLEDDRPGEALSFITVDLGEAKIYPCSMAMDVLALEREDLEDFVGEPMGLTKFLDEASAGQVWTF